jgi:16S rRNA (uracil1498-N3)-methyltransferase
VVERDDRAPLATFVIGAIPPAGGIAALDEAAAHHARVKRLAVGDAVRLVDGAGHLGFGAIAAMRRGALDVSVERTATVAPQPAIHLRVPIGDRDRMLWLAEKATELGVTSWQGVRFRRSASVSPRGEGPAFAEKIRARMLSALEQSGGAWLPTILTDAAPSDAAREPHDLTLLLDAAGEPLAGIPELSSAAPPVLLFGPEGGLEPDERDMLITQGWRPARLASTTLRFETAGIAAVAVFRTLRMLGRAD